jgi:hypothetical protein
LAEARANCPRIEPSAALGVAKIVSRVLKLN